MCYFGREGGKGGGGNTQAVRCSAMLGRMGEGMPLGDKHLSYTNINERGQTDIYFWKLFICFTACDSERHSEAASSRHVCCSWDQVPLSRLRLSTVVLAIKEALKKREKKPSGVSAVPA